MINCWFCTFDPMPLAIMIAQFMGIVFGMGWFPCCCPAAEEVVDDCTGCVDDEGPMSLIVVISGATSMACTSGDGNCTDVNGTYVVDYSNTQSGNCYYYLPDAVPCQGAGASTGVTCGTIGNINCGDLCATITNLSALNVAIQFSSLPFDDGCDGLNFIRSPSGELDCLNLTSVDVPINAYPSVNCGGSFGMPWDCDVSSG